MQQGHAALGTGYVTVGAVESFRQRNNRSARNQKRLFSDAVALRPYMCPPGMLTSVSSALRASLHRPKRIVVRKNCTTLMQRGPGGCTRGEVRSRRRAPRLGLVGRNDASGVANARGNLAADRAGRAPKKSVVGLDCNAVATTAEFFEDVPRSRG